MLALIAFERLAWALIDAAVNGNGIANVIIARADMTTYTFVGALLLVGGIAVALATWRERGSA